jgi:signal transduction histidine kinase
VEPSSDFWSYLIFGVLAFTIIAVVAAVFVLKYFVFRPAEKRAKREADADGSFGHMERTELVSLIQKLDDRNEENVVAREVAKHKFLADFRQELTEPLAFIKNESSVLAQFLQDDSGSKAAKEIFAAANKLEGLISDLYDLYTLEVGKARLAQETVSIQQILDEVKNQFRILAVSSGNKLHVDVGARVGLIITDCSKFRKLLISMVETANSYTSNGMVRVDINYADDGRLRIEVSDDGNEHQDEWQSDWSGLRLPLIKKLAEFLGGGFEIREQNGGGITSVALISVRAA